MLRLTEHAAEKEPQPTTKVLYGFTLKPWHCLPCHSKTKSTVKKQTSASFWVVMCCIFRCPHGELSLMPLEFIEEMVSCHVSAEAASVWLCFAVFRWVDRDGKFSFRRRYVFDSAQLLDRLKEIAIYIFHPIVNQGSLEFLRSWSRLLFSVLTLTGFVSMWQVLWIGYWCIV